MDIYLLIMIPAIILFIQLTIGGTHDHYSNGLTVFGNGDVGIGTTTDTSRF